MNILKKLNLTKPKIKQNPNEVYKFLQCRLKIIKQLSFYIPTICLSHKLFFQFSQSYFCMKKSEQPILESNNSEVMYRKNKARLIDQNRQLYFQINRLESKVNQVLAKNIANDFKQTVEGEQFNELHNQQTKGQIAEIKKLKKKILLLKNSDKVQQKQDIRQTSNELAYLKKEKLKCIYEKQALTKKMNAKNEGLQLNKPLQQQKMQMLTLYKATQRENFQIKQKQLKIQKQVQNFHKIKQMAKTSVPKLAESHEYEIRRMQIQISSLKNQIAQIQKQWQPQIQSLTTQSLILVDIKQQKALQIQKAQRQIKKLKGRMTGLRQEQKILQDRARISSIIISPQKRQEIIQIYQIQKQQRQYFEQFRNPSLNESVIRLIKRQEKDKRQKEDEVEHSPKIKKSKKSLKKIQQKTRSNQKVQISHQELKNQFQEPPVQKHKVQSPKKIFTNVAVGTTFYYNQEEEGELLN